MLIEVKVPVLPESVAEATLVSWHKQPGDAVKRDENLIDIETDKVVLELPAPNAGVLAEIKKGDGSTVTAQEVIAVIDTEGKAAATPAASAPAAAASPATASPPAASAAAASAAEQAAALPSARKMMAEQNVSPAEVSGSGRGGRITKADVMAAVEAKADVTRPAAAPAAPATKGPSVPPPARKLPPGLGTPPH